MNSELASSPKVDPFRNGQFAPVRLLDSTEDAEEIASNPNLLGESDIVDLVRGKVEPLRARLAEIDQSVVVERMLEVASKEDARMHTVKAIETRLVELRPQTHVEVESSESGMSSGVGGSKSVATDSPASGTPIR